ncbi:MAG: GGDEF domain-containing protein [Lachnospiraceae bacterium]|nr:GGDEF domain-containing protein [Lachnospiraceae bacterium]
MAHFNTGTATIDKNMQIVKADKSFYQFIAWENPLYLEQSVCKADFAQLKEAIEAVLTRSGHNMAVYRMLRPDGSLHWVVADLMRVIISEEECVVKMNIQSVRDLEDDLSEMADAVQEFGIYLDIMDELFFKYDPEEDAFRIFMGGDKQRMVLFEGSLAAWEESLVARQPFSDKYHEVFEDLCEDFRQGTRHFSHEIMLPNLIRGESKELYLFKGKTTVDTKGRFYVFGCVYTIAKNSHRKKTAIGGDAARDEMTGLLNKQTITDYVQNAIGGKLSGTGYLCIIDVDNFKYVNDHFGHMFGDEVLISIADIIKDAVEDRGVAGRIGGDEMMIFLENIADRADLKSILRTIRTNVEWAYKGVRDDIHLSCSIGAAACPTDADNYDDLFKIADKMLYRAKECGKNRYIIYTPEIHGNVLDNNVGKPDAVAMTGTGANKEHLVLQLTELFLYKRIWNLQMTLESVGAAFELAEVNIFYDEPVYQPMHWRGDGKKLREIDLNFLKSSKFRTLFTEDHLAVINHTVDLEFSCPVAYEVLKSQDVNAALIYEMNGKVPGYVFFTKEGHSSRLWTESDKIYLNLVGKMIDLVLSGK